MAQANAKCTNCGEIILIDKDKDAEICSHCNSPFVCDKAIALYNNDIEQIDKKSAKNIKRKKKWKHFASILLLIFECIGTLFYYIFFVWLFFDFINDIKKK